MDVQHNRRKTDAIGAPSIIHSDIKLSGFVQAFVRRASCPDINELVFEDNNLIHALLKTDIRDTLHSSVDFAMDNLRATQHATGTTNDDGICIYDNNSTQTGTEFIGIMASVVHPTDPSGNYYRQWTGTWQEPSATETVKSAQMGSILVSGTSFGNIFATEDISPDIALVLNDILTINWKISVG